MYATNLEALDHLYGLLVTNQTALGLKGVWYGDDDFIPKYPAVVCLAEGMDRSLHSTRSFKLDLIVSLYVFHAEMNATYRTRTRNDLMLVDAVRGVLHADYTLAGNIVFGFIQREQPGIGNRPKGPGIVSTSLTWTGESRAAL